MLTSTHWTKICQGCKGPNSLYQKWQYRDTAPTNTPTRIKKRSRTPNEPKMHDNDKTCFTFRTACLCPNSCLFVFLFLRRFAPARCASFTSLWRPKRRRDCALNLYCTVLSVLSTWKSNELTSVENKTVKCSMPFAGPHVQQSSLRHSSAHAHVTTVSKQPHQVRSRFWPDRKTAKYDVIYAYYRGDQAPPTALQVQNHHCPWLKQWLKKVVEKNG